MSQPPSDPPSESTGPPDRQTLQLLEKHLVDDPLVVDTVFEPDAYAPRLVRVRLDVDRYPSTVETVRLDIRWFTSGDFSVHYTERSSEDTRWECRWDRHPNDHNSRLHFHQPPDGTRIDDLPLQSIHPLDVYSTVFTAIDRRIEERWSDDPSNGNDSSNGDDSSRA